MVNALGEGRSIRKVADHYNVGYNSVRDIKDGRRQNDSKFEKQLAKELSAENAVVLGVTQELAGLITEEMLAKM